MKRILRVTLVLAATILLAFFLLPHSASFILPWLSPPTLHLTNLRPSPRHTQGLLTQRYFAVVVPLTSHPTSVPSSHAAWEPLITSSNNCYTSDTLAYRYLVNQGRTVTLVDSAEAIKKHLRDDPTSRGVVPLKSLSPDVRALSSPFPLQEWVTWQRSESVMAEWFGINKPLDDLIAKLVHRSSIELPPALHTFVAVGDIMLGRSLQKRMATHADPLFPFQEIAERLRNADVAIGNLECAITLTGIPAKKPYVFRAEPDAARRLKDAGFTVVSMANNHGGDYGREGLLNSLNHLSLAGIGVLGAGLNHDASAAPWLTTLPDGTVIGIIGSSIVGSSYPVGRVNPGVHVCSSTRFLEEVKAAKSLCDFLIVFPHWGEEYTASPTPAQRTLGRQAIEAGASLVIGHHPHWIQEVECYQDGVIAYSLGNFVFDQFFSEQTTEGLVLTCLISKGRIRQIYTDPVVIQGGTPTFMDPTAPAMEQRFSRIRSTMFPELTVKKNEDSNSPSEATSSPPSIPAETTTHP